MLAGLLLHHPLDALPVLELRRLDGIEQGDLAASVQGAPAGEAQRRLHLLGLVDHDQEDALARFFSGR